MSWRILEGDCREVLAGLEAGSVQTCVTSPPYFGLRDYGTGEWEGGDPVCDHRQDTKHQVQGATSARAGRTNTEAQRNENFRDVCGKCGARRVDRQIGLEPTPDEFVAALVGVFREVRRVLRDDGTVWLNLGDSYNAYNGNRGPAAGINAVADQQRNAPDRGLTWPGAKPKDLLGIPWMVAFALRADGWYLRSEIIWHKPNPMPESVTDRPTKAHEYVFLLSKGPRYVYDADAIREDATRGYELPAGGAQRHHTGNGHSGLDTFATLDGGRNRRSVWTVATAPYPGAHFATFPPKLIEPCILAGSSPKACGVCGAPWQRVVERTGWPDPEHVEDDQGRRKASGDVATDTQRRKQLSGARHAAFKAANPDRTVGWEPSCGHQDDTGQSVVLDPFAGAGTTGMVALRHDRSFIGIELSPEYVRLARDRIIADSPLLNTYAEAVA